MAPIDLDKFQRKYGYADGFSEATVTKAFERAGKACECERTCLRHSADSRCQVALTWDGRGADWQAHHVIAKGQPSSTDDLSNCEILCSDCHKRTQSFGRKEG